MYNVLVRFFSTCQKTLYCALLRYRNAKTNPIRDQRYRMLFAPVYIDAGKSRTVGRSLVQQVALKGKLTQPRESAEGVKVGNLVVAEIELHEPP